MRPPAMQAEETMYVPGWGRVQIVAPTATQVADPTDEPTLILTTCNPRFSASQRLVVFAARDD